MVLAEPTRSHIGGSQFERAVGFLCASIFSTVYVAAPVYLILAFARLIVAPLSISTWLLLLPMLLSILAGPEATAGIGPVLLSSWAFRQIPKYFEYDEYHEVTDAELKEQHHKGQNFIIVQHPHGIFSFVGVCAAVSTITGSNGLGIEGLRDVPTAGASVLRKIPILKDVLGVFGIIDASAKKLAARASRVRGSFVLYVGGMAELFASSSKREAVFLRGRKGFIKLALRSGADVVPVYLFGNTTVLSALKWGPLARLSRKLQVSITFFWGRWLLPLPRPVKLIYVRGKPLGMSKIESPTDAEVDYWHEKYCKQLVKLFDNYKGLHPDYAHKELVVE